MLTKKNAFLIHLAGSLMIFIILLLLIIYVWFPAPYFDMAYRMKWIQLMVFVDVVLGPVLTLIVFKPGKPSLKTDMTVILLVQLSALSWGIYNAWSAHPKMTVYFDSQVYCLNDKDMKDGKVKSEFANTPIQPSITAFLPYPETIEEKRKYLTTGDTNITMALRLGEFYQEMTVETSQALNFDPIDIVSIAKKNHYIQEVWDEFISNYESINPEWRFYPFICLQEKKTLVYDRSQNRVETVLDFGLPLNLVMNR